MYNRFFFIIFCIVAVIFSTMGFPGCSSSRSTGNSHEVQINEDIISALEEIVSIREEQLSVIQDKHKMGYTSYTEVEDSQKKLSEARIRLATAEHKHDVVIEELRKILALQESRLQLAEVRLEQGLVSSQDIADAKIQLLDAQIRLAEAIQESK